MGMYCVVRAVDPTDSEGLADPKKIAGSHHSPRGQGSSVSLEKAWHGLHFLLTGAAWGAEPPLDFLLQGGTPVGEDGGYGPARLFRPEEVQELDTALSGISDEQLWSRFDAGRMEEEQIYPLIWDEPEADLQEEYLGYFHELKRLVHEAAATGKALLVMIT
jgi:hypothetical protein